MVKDWKYDWVVDYIEKKIKDVEMVMIVDYCCDMLLENILVNKVFRVDGVYLYVDILNLIDMLNVMVDEGVICYCWMLCFFNLYYCVVYCIFIWCDVCCVDFYNQCLYVLIVKFYNVENDVEVKWVCCVVVIVQFIIDVFYEIGDDDEYIFNVNVWVGIDIGEVLVVNNGWCGGCEFLFFGELVNYVVKMLGGGFSIGIYFINNVCLVIGFMEVVRFVNMLLIIVEVVVCQDVVNFGVLKDIIVVEWCEDF